MVKLTLDRYLGEHGITRYELAKRSNIKFQIIDNYYKNRVVRYDAYVLDRICSALGCEVGDIIEHRPGDISAACEMEETDLSKSL